MSIEDDRPFGGVSALFDGTGDYIDVSDPDFVLGVDDWVIEFFLFNPSRDSK